MPIDFFTLEPLSYVTAFILSLTFSTFKQNLLDIYIALQYTDTIELRYIALMTTGGHIWINTLKKYTFR